MQKRDIYVRNKSGSPQRLQHPMLMQLKVLPSAPGGYVWATNDSIVFAPGQIICMPVDMYRGVRSVWAMPWTEEVSETDFRRALAKEQDALVKKRVKAALKKQATKQTGGSATDEGDEPTDET